MSAQLPTFGVNDVLAFVTNSLHMAARPAYVSPEVVQIQTSAGLTDVQVFPDATLAVRCRVGRAYTADAEMRDVTLTTAEECAAIGAYNKSLNLPHDTYQTWLERDGYDFPVTVEIATISGGEARDNSGPVPNEGYEDVTVTLGKAVRTDTKEPITLTEAEQEIVKAEYIAEVTVE